jgi:histone-lysine N-methyltransferase SETD7
MAFLYPDLKTGLYGVFSCGRMVSAGPAAVQLATKRDNICCLQFKRLTGSGYNFDLATKQIISSRPLLRDPYEMEYVVVALCKDIHKGEGLFARKYVPANTILAFYNGVKLEGKDCIKSDTWEEDAYKIMDLLETEETESGVLDIPPEYQDTQHYCASLAHKTNHSFKPNTKFTLFSHPRFGLVPALVTLLPVPHGSEVLVNYDYAYDEAPPWFTALSSQHLADAYKLARGRDWETGWG